MLRWCVEVRAAAEEPADLGDDEAQAMPPAEPPASGALSPDDPVLRRAIELLKSEARKARVLRPDVSRAA